MKTKLLFCLLVFSGIAKGQFRVILNFDSANGKGPNGSLVISGNVMYGMTSEGGAYNYGNIFTIDTNGGGYSDLFDFNGTNGENPLGSLVIIENKLYGMTRLGGANWDNYGCIFSINKNGKAYKDLLDFNGTNGEYPSGSLIFSQNKLCAMTSAGGAGYYGCIFSLDTNGKGYNDLFDFNDTNGASPNGSLILSENRLYGITNSGGIYRDGTIFSIDTDGEGYKELTHNFNGIPDGENPTGTMVLSSNKLYGMTYLGGSGDDGVIFSIDTNGSGFKSILEFNGTNGAEPRGSLIALGGRLYGMTAIGGAYHDGTIFSIDTNGSNYKNLFDFDGTNGSNPYGELTVLGNILYGMTTSGGTNNDGVVFSFRDTNISNSINEIISSSNVINIYPNPNSGSFTISLSDANQKFNIEIYNVLGEQIYNAAAPTLPPPRGGGPSVPARPPGWAIRTGADVSVSYGSTISYYINLSSQPNGVYFYRVLNEDGSLIGDGKVIIEK